MRLALVGIALLILAWLAIALRDVRAQEEGREIVSDSLKALARGDIERADPVQLERAGRLLEDARLLNPDVSPLVDRGNQLFLAGRVDEAIDRLQEVVRREPDNVEAWARLTIAAEERDPALAARARAEARRLDPRGAARRSR